MPNKPQVIATASIEGLTFSLQQNGGDYRWYDPNGKPTSLHRLTERDARRAMTFHAFKLAREFRESVNWRGC